MQLHAFHKDWQAFCRRTTERLTHMNDPAPLSAFLADMDALFEADILPLLSREENDNTRLEREREANHIAAESRAHLAAALPPRTRFF